MATVDTAVTPTLFYTPCQYSYRLARTSEASSRRVHHRAARMVGNGFSEKGSGHKQPHLAYRCPLPWILPAPSEPPISDAGAEAR